MNTHLDELINRWRQGQLSDEELRHLIQVLATPEGRAALRGDWFLEAALPEALRTSPVLKLSQKMDPMETPHAKRSTSWLSWRPLTAAAAGVVLGLFCASVGWAYTSPRIVAEARRLSALVDGSFEKKGGRVPSGFPVGTAVWRGDEAEIVEGGMVEERDGGRTLRFLRAEGNPNVPNSAADACDVFQLVDLRSLRTELKATGDSILELSAEFLDARTAPGVPVVFACHIYLFEGSAESLQAVWPPTARDTLGVGANYIRSSGGPDAGEWRKVTARCVWNPQADIAVVKLSAGRGDQRGGPAPELGRQFADDVKLVLKTQPTLPVRIVEH